MTYVDEYDDPFGDDTVGGGRTPSPSRGNGGSNFVPPAAQTELGKNYNQFFVKAYKDGEKPFCEDYRDIDKAASRASFLHFKEGWGTRLIAVNTEAGTAAELRWKDRDTGYAVHSGR